METETKENLQDFSKPDQPNRARPPLKTLTLSSVSRPPPCNPQ